MMREISRMVSTLFVWAALATSMWLFFDSGDVHTAVPGAVIMVVLTVAAWAATKAIWRGDGEASARTDRVRERSSGKLKRTSRERIERLVESLDEDEVVELETLLLAREAAHDDLASPHNGQR